MVIKTFGIVDGKYVRTNERNLLLINELRNRGFIIDINDCGQFKNTSEISIVLDEQLYKTMLLYRVSTRTPEYTIEEFLETDLRILNKQSKNPGSNWSFNLLVGDIFITPSVRFIKIISETLVLDMITNTELDIDLFYIDDSILGMYKGNYYDLIKTPKDKLKPYDLYEILHK